MKATTKKTDRAALNTQHAYCALHYTNWFACAALLGRLGFTQRETEAILLSKWMRWASDQRPHNRRPTSGDLARFMVGIKPGSPEVAELLCYAEQSKTKTAQVVSSRQLNHQEQQS